MDDPIIRPREAMRMLGIKNTTLYEWVKQGLLPAPIKLGPRATGWRKSTLDAFLDGRAAQGGQ